MYAKYFLFFFTTFGYSTYIDVRHAAVAQLPLTYKHCTVDDG